MSTPGASHPSPTTVEDLNRVLDVRAVRPVFQPLVGLDNRHVVGYEALARGPLASAAFTEAVSGGPSPPRTLFVNAEPVSLGVACPDDLRAAIEQGRGRLRVVVEVTERALAGDPARLLATVAQARQAGCGVALDDVGAAPATLAVLPFVRPHLIKLDMRLLQGRTTTEAAHIVNAVRAQAEAMAAGATIGQGFLFGHPGPLPTPTPEPGAAIPLQVPADVSAETPWEVVAAARAPRRAVKDLLVEMCMQLEHQGLDAAKPTACRSARSPGSAGPTWTPATRCAASGAWS